MRRLTTPSGIAGILCLVQVLFGVHYYGAKIVVGAIPPRGWAFIRVAGAAAFLLPLALALRRKRPLPAAGDMARLAGLSILGVMINQWCFVEGLSRTTLSHSSLINCSIPVLTLLFALLLGHETVDGRRLFSIALALTGVVVLLRVDDLVWDQVTKGDLWTLVNACSFSLFLVLSRPLLARLDALMATGLLFGFGTLALLPLGAGSLRAIELQSLGPAVWGWAIYSILGATVLAYWLNYVALRHVESSYVALFIFLQPLLAATMDVWLMGSVLTHRLTLAAGLIMTGVALSIIASRRRAITPLPRGG